MPRTARGAVTLFDVTDGTNPITAFLTNQNHTFAAMQTGLVSAETRRMFSSMLNVFVGGTQASYDSGLATGDGTTGQTANRFRIASVTSSNSDFTVGFNDTNSAVTVDTVSRAPGEIYVSVVPEEAAATSTLTVTFAVSNELGTVTGGLVAEITISIVAQGAGGVVINMDPTSQYFFADSDGNIVDMPAQSAVVVDLSVTGTTGNMTVATSQNGAGFIDQTMTGTGAGSISGWDDDDAGNFQTGPIGTTIRRLQISPDNLGDTNNTLSIRVRGASGGQDVITIAKVRVGAAGAAAIIVSVESSTNGNVFRTSTGSTPSDKTLSVTVFDAATGNQIQATGISTYAWFRGDGSTAVLVDDITNRNVVPAGTAGGVTASGSDFSTIVVGSSDVDMEEAFYCEVTTTS